VKKLVVTLVVIVVGMLLFFAVGPLYVIREGEQAVIVRFGRIIKVDTQAGLHGKMPLVDKVQRYSKKILS
jgi:membrane protease subunit HflC